MATLSISLTVPLSILADILWKEKRYGPLFFAGAVPMFCSYFIVALLTHFQDWDPLMDLLRYAQCNVDVWPGGNLPCIRIFPMCYPRY